MATDMPSESTRRHSLDSFTDREPILTQFSQLLHSTQAGEFHLLAIKGNSGNGKTLLIEYLSKRICPPAGWHTDVLSFTQDFPDFRTILYWIEGALKKCVPGPSLKQYRAQRNEYNRRFDEYRATITVNQSVEAKEFSSVSQVQQTARVNVELRRREVQLRAELTRALLELAEECEKPLCLFIDGYERLVETDPELVGWMWEQLLLKLPPNSPKPVLIITCGWEQPMSAALQPFSTYGELDDFDLPRVRDYLQAQSLVPSDATIQTPLVIAFYDLTGGHPLVLSLSVIYMQALPEEERTPDSLRTKSPLITEEARVRWLEERLLKRLPEPYRTLLERGPILRSFDQAVLQALINIEQDEKNNKLALDDRTYALFLQYPFINRKNAQGEALLEQPTFHDLVRRVRLEALRRLYPETKQRLHQTMADYYLGRIEAEQQRGLLPQTKPSDQYYTERFAEIPEQEFRAQVEFLYHALQVKEMQAEAFNRWQSLVARAVNRWHRQQDGPLLEVVQQLTEEGEPFLSKTSEPYAQYLIWYAKFIEQEARWKEAQEVLEQAAKIFEQVGNLSDRAACLNNIGVIYFFLGKLKQALNYYNAALPLVKQVGNPVYIAAFYNNIGQIYQQQGELEQALSFYETALTLFKQEDNINPGHIATFLNNIATIYSSQGDLEQALNLYEAALDIREHIGNPFDIANSLSNIGEFYREQGDLKRALSYHERALALSEQEGNYIAISHCLRNIGRIYSVQGELEQALSYHKRGLVLREQIGNPSDIAESLNDIGQIYFVQGDLKQTLSYYKRALALREQIGNPIEIARSLNDVGFIYSSLGDLEQGLSYIKRVLTLREQVSNTHLIAGSLHNIGFIYSSLKDYEQALSYYEQALALREQGGNSAEIATTLNNIASIYHSQGKLGQALSYYKRALTLAEHMDNFANLAEFLGKIGVIYYTQGELVLALDYFERALPLREQGDNPTEIATTLNNIATIYYIQEKLEQALSYFKRELALREQVGDPAALANCLYKIGRTYQQQRKWRQAIEYYTNSLSLYESLGHGFESEVTDQLERLAQCHAQLGEAEKSSAYEVRAREIREDIQKTS